MLMSAEANSQSQLESPTRGRTDQKTQQQQQQTVHAGVTYLQLQIQVCFLACTHSRKRFPPVNISLM